MSPLPDFTASSIGVPFHLQTVFPKIAVLMTASVRHGLSEVDSGPICTVHINTHGYESFHCFEVARRANSVEHTSTVIVKRLWIHPSFCARQLEQSCIIFGCIFHQQKGVGLQTCTFTNQRFSNRAITQFQGLQEWRFTPAIRDID